MSVGEALGLASPRLERFGREFLWVIAGQGFSILGGIVGIRLLTHALPPAAYGKLSLAMTVASLLQVTLSILAETLSRFFSPARETDQLGAYLQAAQILVVRATIAVAAVAIVLEGALWILKLSGLLWLLLGATTFALFSGYASVLNGIQNAARQRRIVAWHQALGQWMTPLTAVAVTAIIGARSGAAMLGYVVAAAVVLGSQYTFFHRKILVLNHFPLAMHPADAQNILNKMQAYAWPFATWGLLAWAQVASPRWLLQMFAATSDVGLYSVLSQMGYYPMTILSAVLVQFVSPILYSYAGDGSNPARVRRAHQLNIYVAYGSLALTALATLAAALLHRRIFSLLVAPEYHTASPLLPWMVLSGGLFASGQTASLLLMTNMNTRKLIVPKTVSALLGILLSFIGTSTAALSGAVLANLSFSAVYSVWMLYLARAIRLSSRSTSNG